MHFIESIISDGGLPYWIGTIAAAVIVGMLLFLANIWPGGYDSRSASGDNYGVTGADSSKKRKR